MLYYIILYIMYIIYKILYIIYINSISFILIYIYYKKILRQSHIHIIKYSKYKSFYFLNI